MTWRMSVKSGKSSPGSPIASGLHSAAESVPVLVMPRDATAAAVTRGAAVPMLNRVSGVTGVCVTTSLHPNPSAQTMPTPMPTAIETPGRFCSTMAARTIGRARSTAAAHCGEGADALTDGTSGGCAKRGALTETSWVRNAANAAMRTPTASAVRAAQIGIRFRAVLTPITTAASISRNPPTAPPGASSAMATYRPIAAMARPRATRANAFTGFVTEDLMCQHSQKPAWNAEAAAWYQGGVTLLYDEKFSVYRRNRRVAKWLGKSHIEGSEVGRSLASVSEGVRCCAIA